MASEESKPSTPPPEPEPNTDYKKVADESLRSGIKSLVNTTNTTLASLEHTTNVTSTSIVSRLNTIGHQLRYAYGRWSAMYNNRQTYGVPVIAGSALVVGSIVGVRRGKIVGGVSALFTGGGCYANIYGINNTPGKRKYT